MTLHAKTQNAILKHLETYLGPVAVGWTRNADGVSMPFDVLRFDNAPNAGTVTFATVGLSQHTQRSQQTGKIIPQEFMMSCHDDQKDLSFPAVLQQVGAQASRQGRALLRGEVIGPRGQLFPGSQMTALYAAIPIYFPESMHSMIPSTGGETVFVWLLPLYESEAKLVAAKGWETFERRLAEMDPDVTDLGRPAVI
jgi:hypothetical protein